MADPENVIEKVLGVYGRDALAVDHIDGISVDMGRWRFNLRMSTTQPVIRLNVESRSDEALMCAMTGEVIRA